MYNLRAIKFGIGNGVSEVRLWKTTPFRHDVSSAYSITKTCPCYIQRFFKVIKNENFQKKNLDIFLIFAQNIDCGYTLEPPRRGGSNVYPQSMFWSKNKKNRYSPMYPSFAI